MKKNKSKLYFIIFIIFNNFTLFSQVNGYLVTIYKKNSILEIIDNNNKFIKEKTNKQFSLQSQKFYFIENTDSLNFVDSLYKLLKDTSAIFLFENFDYNDLYYSFKQKSISFPLYKLKGYEEYLFEIIYVNASISNNYCNERNKNIYKIRIHDIISILPTFKYIYNKKYFKFYTFVFYSWNSH